MAAPDGRGHPGAIACCRRLRVGPVRDGLKTGRRVANDDVLDVTRGLMKDLCDELLSWGGESRLMKDFL